MRVLLDTHALLWFYLGDAQFSATARTAITDPRNSKLVSPASYWELAIKISLGKYVLTETYDEFVQHAIFDNGFVILPVEPKHTAALIALPFHHKDPFDRLLVAQALVEGIPLVSADPVLDQHPITRLW
ncbi:MAG: type II toxin-antitoxin system VapC family toxin [Gemmataceae bacterium]|nr:type II toxin-antitoxin system VapC family toxin [Gemmataceae bacterium]